MVRILVDSSIIIDHLRLKEKKSTLFFRLSQKYKINSSILTHVEVYSGKNVWEEEEVAHSVEKIFEGIEILELNKSVSIVAGKLKAVFNLGLGDAIIAATALEYNMPI